MCRIYPTFVVILYNFGFIDIFVDHFYKTETGKRYIVEKGFCRYKIKFIQNFHRGSDTYEGVAIVFDYKWNALNII